MSTKKTNRCNIDSKKVNKWKENINIVMLICNIVECFNVGKLFVGRWRAWVSERVPLAPILLHLSSFIITLITFRLSTKPQCAGSIYGLMTCVMNVDVINVSIRMCMCVCVCVWKYRCMCIKCIYSVCNQIYIIIIFAFFISFISLVPCDGIEYEMDWNKINWLSVQVEEEEWIEVVVVERWGKVYLN